MVADMVVSIEVDKVADKVADIISNKKSGRHGIFFNDFQKNA